MYNYRLSAFASSILYSYIRLTIPTTLAVSSVSLHVGLQLDLFLLIMAETDECIDSQRSLQSPTHVRPFNWNESPPVDSGKASDLIINFIIGWSLRLIDDEQCSVSVIRSTRLSDWLNREMPIGYLHDITTLWSSLPLLRTKGNRSCLNGNWLEGEYSFNREGDLTIYSADIQFLH